MADESQDDSEKQRRPPALPEVTLEQAQEASLRTLYEALRSRIDTDERVLDLFPADFAEQIRRERKGQR